MRGPRGALRPDSWTRRLRGIETERMLGGWPASEPSKTSVRPTDPARRGIHESKRCRSGRPRPRPAAHSVYKPKSGPGLRRRRDGYGARRCARRSRCARKAAIAAPRATGPSTPWRQGRPPSPNGKPRVLRGPAPTWPGACAPCRGLVRAGPAAGRRRCWWAGSSSGRSRRCSGRGRRARCPAGSARGSSPCARAAAPIPGDAAPRRPTRRSLRRPTSGPRRTGPAASVSRSVGSSVARRVDVGVAVDHPEAHELGALEARDHPEHALLLAPLELGLEADQRVVARGQVVLAQLHDGVRAAAGARIDEADRLHRPEAQGLLAAARHHLDRQAALEEELVLEVVERRRTRRGERAVEGVGTAPRRAGSSGSRRRPCRSATRGTPCSKSIESRPRPRG